MALMRSSSSRDILGVALEAREGRQLSHVACCTASCFAGGCLAVPVTGTGILSGKLSQTLESSISPEEGSSRSMAVATEADAGAGGPNTYPRLGSTAGAAGRAFCAGGSREPVLAVDAGPENRPGTLGA